MSEYQYYEFAAVERPLTRAEIAELSAISTRAVITPTSFTNHYEWGDLKADPAEWMRRYFDAFVYFANWFTCQYTLRLPKETFQESELEPFGGCSMLLIESTDTHWIFSWTLDESDNYDRFGAEDGAGWMQKLLPLRDELLRGDLRSLYLGWLASVDGWDDGDELEPVSLPAGLGEWSPAQHDLAAFLEITPDLLKASCAARAASVSSAIYEQQSTEAWLETWQTADWQGVIEDIALGQGQQAERRVKLHYAAWLKAQLPVQGADTLRRSVAELHELAEALRAG